MEDTGGGIARNCVGSFHSLLLHRKVANLLHLVMITIINYNYVLIWGMNIIARVNSVLFVHMLYPSCPNN